MRVKKEYSDEKTRAALSRLSRRSTGKTTRITSGTTLTAATQRPRISAQREARSSFCATSRSMTWTVPQTQASGPEWNGDQFAGMKTVIVAIGMGDAGSVFHAFAVRGAPDDNWPVARCAVRRATQISQKDTLGVYKRQPTLARRAITLSAIAGMPLRVRQPSRCEFVA